MKRVTRTYKTKKGIVSKTYEYVGYSKPKASRKTSMKKGITKGGTVSKNLGKNLSKLGYTPEQIRDIERNAKVKAALGNKNWSLDRLVASFKHDRLAGMFANAGLSVEEAALEIGTTEESLYDANNWAGDKFTDPVSGRVWQFEFNYNGSVWHEVKSDA